MGITLALAIRSLTTRRRTYRMAERWLRALVQSVRRVTRSLGEGSMTESADDERERTSVSFSVFQCRSIGSENHCSLAKHYAQRLEIRQRTASARRCVT
jgi:hypothetical protein